MAEREFKSDWLPGYTIIQRKGGHAWQIGIIRDQDGKMKVRVASGRLDVQVGEGGAASASVKQQNKINVTDSAEWEKVSNEVRTQLQKLAELKQSGQQATTKDE
jgi:hypothetical protein